MIHRGLWPLFAWLGLAAIAGGCRKQAIQAAQEPTIARSKVNGRRHRLLGGSRPVRMYLPAGHRRGRRYPLLLVLHGYGSDAAETLAKIDFRQLVDRERTLLMAPNGTMDRNRRRFWNAAPECCDYFDKRPKDAAYLAGLLDEALKTGLVDRNRVYVVGHSNGGHMAYRMACERADLLAAIVSQAGADFGSVDCVVSRAVSVLHIHGDHDGIVPYYPSRRERPGRLVNYPGAAGSVSRWRARNRCSSGKKSGGFFRGRVFRSGVYTVMPRSARGCARGVDVTLWTILRGSHAADDLDDLAERVWHWLLRHPKAGGGNGLHSGQIGAQPR